MIYPYLLTLCLSLSLVPVTASEPLKVDARAISINADKSVRCKKDKRACVAEGNVKLRKGDEEFKADKLKAHFTGEQALESAKAQGNVSYKSGKFHTQTPQADYSVSKNELVAKGAGSRVKELTKDRELEADHIHVKFHPTNAKHHTGKDLKAATATKDVKIRTNTEYLTSDKAEYEADTGHVEATGKVVITRKEGCLQATSVSGNLNSKAYVAGKSDLETKSEAPATKDKVYGIFFRDAKPKKSKS